MDWTDLFAAFALYLVIEGLLPFANPRGWRESVELIAQLSDRNLRIFGLVSMLAGAALLAFIRG
ncbi:MAG: DUF2065 domain-containing protein [Chromatiales bacterium]|jgi:uncharacterized protein YjeT (DUF2065 family)